ncbi:biotin--[acetyl-CoA-carboxylase] ligase [Alcaligenaceae bacterium CGII-47]|nr:biotin--[acetyl-CoA-carboxylase] ligase [Alcaligenaceae bacterium CGII-47]
MADLATDFLPEPAQLIQSLRSTLSTFQRIDWQERVGSTNAELLAHARTNDGILARPWLLGAHLQEHGRGRAGRTWQNRHGANLMFSCAFDVFLPARTLPTLSPFLGIAACEALRGLLTPSLRPRLTMKWPNDILWDQGKLAGILVETSRSGAAVRSPDHHVVIIGIGINLEDARALSHSLNRQIADWALITQADPLIQQHGAATLITRIAQAWYRGLNEATAHGFDKLPQRYALVDSLVGQMLDITDDGRLLQTGVACGVNAQGQLLLRNTSGEHAISVGEISVRTRL